MRDLTLISKKHLRYEHGVPVKGMQHCGRVMIIKNSNFSHLMNGTPVTPTEGFLVRIINTDVQGYPDVMQPKLMTLVSDTTNKIELKGVPLTMMGINAADFSDYAITLHLINRKVVKSVLHILDRGVDIEYLDIQP